MDAIEELLTRGVDTIYPSREELEKVLRSGKKLKLYQGFDPTGTELHIGHMVGLRKLRQWQDLGHHVIFLIGDGTGQAGDPSGKLIARERFLTQEELRKNAKEYVMQAAKIVRFDGENPVEILYNGDWLNKLTLPEILDIFDHFSLQQLEERDLFVERKKREEPIKIREFIYPILQGYDSVVMEVDLEIGGTDQTFNMLIGRQLLKTMRNKHKFVMTTPLLTDAQGQKIGKTEGNVIALTDKPEDLYGKIMSLGDDVIVKGFEYLTDVPMEKVGEVEKKLSNEENPMNLKKELAHEIVSELHSKEDASRAEQYFETLVKSRETPLPEVLNMPNIPVFKLPEPLISGPTIVDVLTNSGTASSRAEAKSVIQQGGTEVNNLTITNPNELLRPYLKEGKAIIKFGKKKILKVESEENK